MIICVIEGLDGDMFWRSEASQLMHDANKKRDWIRVLGTGV